MAKKQSEKNNNDNKKDDGGKKDSGISVVVLKVDMNCECEGCAGKAIKSIRCFDGVESVKIGDGDLNKLTVVGKVDPSKLREKVEQKMKRKVELVSPKKEKKGDVEKEKNGDVEKEKSKGSGGGQKKQQQDEKKSMEKKDEKKSKEPPVTSSVLKMHLHCRGCVEKIHKVVSKTKGYMEMSIDKEKDLVTVKGAIDVKAMAEALKEKLKRPVEIVPPKKEGAGEKKGKGGGESKAAANVGGGDIKAAGGHVGGGEGGGKVEGHKMEHGVQMDHPYPHPYPYGFDYGSGYGISQVHAPQMFSDENPNACVVM